MSEIKNVPGAPLGPGGIDPTNQPDTSQRPHHGSRFRDIARRMREKELEAELQAQQGNTQQPAAGVTDPSKADALQRKAQLLGGQANPQAGASPLTNAKITPGSTPFGTPNAPAASGSGINLQEAFGQGTWTRNPPPGQAGAAGAAGAPFRPTFMMDVSSVNIAAGVSSPLNPVRFATPETCDWLVNQKLPALGFAGATVIQKNSLSTGAGPFGATQKELWIQLPDGTQFNAGVLADYYIRNPEDQFPGLADKYAKDMVLSEIRGKTTS